MMKTPIAFLIALALLFAFSACGESDQASEAQTGAEQGAALEGTAQENTVLGEAPTSAGTGRVPRVTPLCNGEDQVTVMVYMCGSELESDGKAATTDIKKILYATPSGNEHPANRNILIFCAHGGGTLGGLAPTSTSPT